MAKRRVDEKKCQEAIEQLRAEGKPLTIENIAECAEIDEAEVIASAAWTQAKEDEKKAKEVKVETATAEKKQSGADAIREMFNQGGGLQRKNADIVRELAKKGIKVSAPQVSQERKKLGGGTSNGKGSANHRSPVAKGKG